MATRNETINIIKTALADEGFSPLAISASLARFASESSFNPRAINKDDAGPGKDSIGFNQWNQGRLANLKRFASQRGTSIYDPDTQARFYAAEVKGDFGGQEAKYGSKLLAATNPTEAAEAVTSLARPRGWTPSNPSGGLGFKRTLNLTNQFASGNFNVPKGGARSDTGANVGSDHYVAGPDRFAGPDAPSLLASISTFVDPKANNGQGIKGGQPVQGPPIPPEIFKAASGNGSESTDQKPEDRIGNVLTGLMTAIGTSLDKQREETKKLKNPLFDQAVRTGLEKPLTFAQIKGMIHV